DLVLLEQELDALGEPGDDLVLARVHLFHVHRDRQAAAVANGDAPFPRVLDDLQRVSMFEERLGRDAPPDQARPAERLLLLDTGDLETELRCTDGGHVPAGAGANDDDVVIVGHFFSEDKGTNEVAGNGWGAAALTAGSAS